MRYPLNPFSCIGGFPYTGGLLLRDSRSLFGISAAEAEVERYGIACTSGAPDLTVSEWPRPGAATMTIDVVGAPPSSFVALLGATSNANFNVAGCVQLVQPGQAALLVPTSASGVAAVALPVPNNPAFVGVELFFQVAALDAAAPAGFTLSRGLRLRVGD